MGWYKKAQTQAPVVPQQQAQPQPVGTTVDMEAVQASYNNIIESHNTSWAEALQQIENAAVNASPNNIVARLQQVNEQTIQNLNAMMNSMGGSAVQ